MRRKLIYCVAAACVAVMLCGCERMEVGRGSGLIHINVKATNATKSTAITTSSLEAAGRFVLDVIVDDSYTEVEDDGTPTGPTYSAGSYITSGGSANVFYSSASNSYTAETRDDEDDSTDGWYIYAGGKYEPYNWINGVKMHFWARYPEDSQVDGGTGEGDLDVTLPGVGDTTEDFEYSLPAAVAGSDATNQKDILFAYAERLKQKQDASDDIDITFHHALSEVRFCVSPDDGTFDVSMSIKRIEITNVADGGSCTFDGKGTITAGTMFDWTPSSDLESYSQDYGGTSGVMFDAAPSGWTPSAFTSSGSEFHVYTCDNAFMLIPQTAGSTTKIKVTFGNTGTGSDITREIPITGQTFKPGYYYNYKIQATKAGRDIAAYVILVDWMDRDSKILIY